MERLGGEWRDKPSGAVTLVIHGDLAGSTVADPDRGYSDKLVHAQTERAQGHHVHVIDAAGFSDLLHRRPARCRRLHRTTHGPAPAPNPDDDVLAEPFDPTNRKLPPPRTPHRLTTDLAALDRGTRAHEQTLRRLAQRLTTEGLEPKLPPRRAPQFDLGWRSGRAFYIAEVKSLTGTNPAQQIRLGLGRVLDYATQLRHLRARPVLALESRPTDQRWQQLADATSVLLLWGPDFDGLPRHR